MTPQQLAKALGLTINCVLPETVHNDQHDEDVEIFGTFKPGSNEINIADIRSQTIYHEIAHAIHYRVFPHHFEFENLLQLELVADTVAMLLCAFDDTPINTEQLSFRHATPADVIQATSTASIILAYILYTMESRDDKRHTEHVTPVTTTK